MYPTQEEILATRPKYRKGTIATVRNWKKENIKDWKYKSNEEKIKLLKLLIQSLGDIYEKPVKEIILCNEDMYDMKNMTIYLNKDKPSIITTLHEFGHHIHGESELKTCRWSVWLFKTCFPGLYDKLQWDNHMLVKR